MDRLTERDKLTRRMDLAYRFIEAFSADDTEVIMQRLEAGDSGCLEIHVQYGKPKTIRLRDWSLGKQSSP